MAKAPNLRQTTGRIPAPALTQLPKLQSTPFTGRPNLPGRIGETGQPRTSTPNLGNRGVDMTPTAQPKFQGPAK